MSAPDDGGPAFSRSAHVAHDYHICDEGEHGMTLRDYFAAKAMPALMAGIEQVHVANMSRGISRSTAEAETQRALTALPESAYKIADAMLAARKRAR